MTRTHDRHADVESRRQARRWRRLERRLDGRPWHQRLWWVRGPVLLARAVRRIVALVVSLPGRRRRFGWPLLAAVAAAVLVAPLPWALAAVLAVAAAWLRERRGGPRRVVSDREAWLWAGALAVVAVAQQLLDGRPWWAAPAATIPTSVAWIWGRRTRRPGRFEQAWAEHVAGEQDWARSTVRDVRVKVDRKGYPDGTFTLVVAKGQTAKDVATKGDELASHLADAFPVLTAGSLMVSHGHGDPIRQARVAIANPRRQAEPRYWREPSLDERTGLYQIGDTMHDGSRAQMWQHAGGVNTVAVGGPGKGKGGFTVVTDVEAAISRHVVLIVLDGKRGAGVPALRYGASLYARTPGQWIVAWDAAMTIMRMRADEYGEAGKSLWSPQSDPLIKVTCDEWRYIHRAWPQMREDAVWWTGQTRSYGGHLHLNLHRGDGDGYGDTEIRSNMYANGQAWIGPQGDLSAENCAVQSWGVKPATLPPYPGWGDLCQTINGDVGSAVRAKNLWLPTNAEVAEFGVPAPHGTADDIIREHAVFPSLPPAMQAVLDTAREAIESGRADQPEAVEEARERAAATQGRPETVDALILAALANAPDQAAGATDLAKAIGRDRAYVQERLTVLRDTGRVLQEGPRRPYRLPAPAQELEPAS
jgi:hypothetical protein